MSDIRRIGDKYYDFGTKNTSFLLTAQELKTLGIKNWYFMLEVKRPDLGVQDIDPHAENISAEDAAKLAASQVGVYISNPRTMINLGFDINEQSLSNIDTILMVMDDDTITADFRLKSEDLADSFSILIKASYVGNLRREGIKVNVAELKEMFTQQLNTVSVNGMPLSQEQKDSIIQVITSLLESL